MPNERYRAVKWARELLEDLTIPSETPKIASHIRDRARSCLRHFPSELDMDTAAEACPETFSREFRMPNVLPKKTWWFW